MKVAKTDNKQLTPNQQFMLNLRTQVDGAFENAGKAITKHITPDRAYMFLNMAVRDNPKLLECTPISIVTSIISISLMGLDMTANEAYVVPFYNKNKKRFDAKPIVSYKGAIKNIYRFKMDKNTPLVTSINAYEVKKNDLFKASAGSDAKIVHEIDIFKDRGLPVAYYAIAKLTGGGEVFYLMTADEIEAYAKKYSKSVSKETGELYGPWKTEFAEMAKKTVVLRLKKLLPSSLVDTDYSDTTMFDNRVVEVHDGDLIPVNEEFDADPDPVPETIDPDTGEIKEEKKDEPEDIEELDGNPFTGNNSNGLFQGK